jgi:hypothetical protein
MWMPLASILLFGGLTVPLIASIETSPFELTVVLNFEGSHSLVEIHEMQREAERVLDSSGVRLRWNRLGAEAVETDLVLMTFTGSCRFGVSPARPKEPGPYAVTQIVDGRITPFGKVNCDRVVSSAFDAMSPDDYTRGDRLIGRAIGRVVAHELIHMLTGSRRHGNKGIEKPALTGEELIAASLSSSMLDIYRVKQHIRNRCRLFSEDGAVSQRGCRVLQREDFNAN